MATENEGTVKRKKKRKKERKKEKKKFGSIL